VRLERKAGDRPDDPAGVGPYALLVGEHLERFLEAGKDDRVVIGLAHERTLFTHQIEVGLGLLDHLEIAEEVRHCFRHDPLAVVEADAQCFREASASAGSLPTKMFVTMLAPKKRAGNLLLRLSTTSTRRH